MASLPNPLRIFFPAPHRRRRDFTAASSSRPNPLFSTRPSKRNWWLGIIALLIVAAGSVYLIASPRFRITSVRVEGTSKIDPKSIEDFVNAQLNTTFLGIAWKRVIWLTPTRTLTDELRGAIEKRVSLKALKLTRTGRSALLVRIEERSPNLIWKSVGGRYYFLDDRGYVVENMVGEPPPDVAVLQDANALTVTINTQATQPNLIAAISTLRDRLPSIGVTPQAFSTWEVSCASPVQPAAPENDQRSTNSNANRNQNVNRPDTDSTSNLNDSSRPNTACDQAMLAVNEPTLVVTTTEKWEVRFDTAGNLDLQINKLAIALRERISPLRQQLKYVDVRYGDRIFYQ